MILVFGSINLDLVFRLPALPRPGETVVGTAYRLLPGGKGANQAVAAARDGAAVRMVGRVGADAFAGLALAGLGEAGIDLRSVTPGTLPTGSAAVLVDGEGRNQIAVASGANQEVSADLVADQDLQAGTTLLLQMEVPAAENERLIRRAHTSGARVVLNLAPAAVLGPQVLAAVAVLVVNEIEAAALAAAHAISAEEPAVLARALAERFANTAVVTLGGEGAIAAGGGQAWRIGALPITPVDTTGAGDAFVGVLAAALDRGAALPQALHRASVAGGLACLGAGAQPSLPERGLIDRHLAMLGPAMAL